ncbi:serine protease inhibitor 27A-like [Contarinia nasturtii]|uniref:serine protease inhibitor 27A-like n=1 Tax=Contarinia nasturtii TaxID=265458 RepID=UPI0012D46605|nr:serine protease inhibitor 27A-like [Contarinia nasturtii]
MIKILLSLVFLIVISCGVQLQEDNTDHFKNGLKRDEFDWTLTQKVLATYNQKNVVVSPFFLILMLSILAEAAGKDTSSYQELSTGVPNISNAEKIRELLKSLMQSNELKFGTSLFVDTFIQPNQKFLAIIKALYFSDIESIDFSNPQMASNTINAWCASATNNQLNDIVTSDDVKGSVILLLNTLYGRWSMPFVESDSDRQNFHLKSGENLSVQFMRKTGTFYYHESTELDTKFLRLPYDGQKFAIYIALPNDDGLDELVARIDRDNFYLTQVLMEKVEVAVSMPKFKFFKNIGLNDILKYLGIRQIFTNGASFPILARGRSVQDRLQVSNILQKVGIEFYEKESTTNATESGSLVNSSGTAIQFNVNREFLFLIQDETTGILIFAGIVTNPE